MRKLIILNMLITLSLFADIKFEDVAKEHWAYSSINSLVKKGIIVENKYKFDGNAPVTKYEFVTALSRAVDYLENKKANKKDLDILETLMFDFSQELNTVAFDTKTFNNRISNMNENIEILKQKLYENEKVIEELKNKIEQLEKKH